MNSLYHAQARIDDLRRSAKREQLATIARTGQPNRSIIFYQQSRRYLGQGLVWLGSRLQTPLDQPAVVCKTTVNGNAPLVLSECC
jgi:hypothetical protein